jgi:hypothetical protein
MADDESTTEQETPTPTPATLPATGNEADLGDAGKRALDAERAARKTAEDRVKVLEPFETQAKEIEDAAKSELDKEREARAALEVTLATLQADNLKNSIALSKGVPSAAIKFLSGTTQEELETSADELMALTTPGATPTNNTRPKEKLTPGGVQPDNEESLDPGELAKRIQAATN